MADSAPKKGVGSWPMWLLGLVIMIDQVDQNVVRGLVTELKADSRLHMTDFKIGVLLSCFVVVNGVITVPAGYLADRWHRTRTVGHTIIGWSGITALSAAIPSFPWLVSVRSALGFGQAITEPSCASLLGDYYPPDVRGKAFSIQQCLLLVGTGLGVGLGGVVGAALGWRAAFLVVAAPGIILAVLVYKLREPRRGEADASHLGLDVTGEHEHHNLLDEGVGQFAKDLVTGLRQDAKTIWSIPTMRYALVGVSALLFTITAVAAALPQFYERTFGVGREACPVVATAASPAPAGRKVVATASALPDDCKPHADGTLPTEHSTGTAELAFTLLVLIGGVPGVLAGGRLADRFQDKVRGARMAIPAYCLLVGNGLFFASYLKAPFVVAYPMELVGLFITCMAIPALRAGLTDAVPHNLRGAGFGFFNLASVLFGSAAAPVVVFALSGAFGDNLRTAFLIVTPPVFLGALILLKARDHLDEDAAKIFMAIATAVQEQQARDEAAAAEAAAKGSVGAGTPEGGTSVGAGGDPAPPDQAP